jgi:CPA1 family monovalent cation:H+ antiporter
MEGTATIGGPFLIIRFRGGDVSELESVLALLITGTVAAVVARWVSLSFTLWLLMLGLVLGALNIGSFHELSSDVILLLYLPPLLFEASFVFDLSLLWRVRTGVLALAGPGVLLAMIVAGGIVHWGLSMPWSIALLFGAIVAATDPGAVLVTFRQLRVDKRLGALLEGESLLNDGVALVLLVVLVDVVEDGFSAGSAVGTFLASVIGGCAVGLAIGVIGHLLISKIDDHLTEMSVSVAVAYASFLLAEEAHLSGVLATVAAAMTLGHLGRTRGWVYSHGSQELLTDLWGFLAFVANAALFLTMGLAVRTTGLIDHPRAVLLGIAAALAGRAVVAYGFGDLLDRAGFRLDRGERHVLFWGGLRGAVALAAALSLPSDFPRRETLLAMTYGVVLFTLLAQGLTISRLLERVAVRKAPA